MKFFPKLNVSNKISLGRICIIIPFVFCLIQVQHNNLYRYACLFIMLIAGFSDILDGYLARKRNETTTLGKYLDPIADKLVLAISCVILSSDHVWPEPRLPYWMPTIIICKDLLLIFGAMVLFFVTGEMNCQPTMLSKMSTFLQIIAVVSVLVGNHIPIPILFAIWKITIILTLTSVLLYMYKGVKHL